MTPETVEGEVREVMVIDQPREMLAQSITPEGTIALASRMATALKDIVEKQKLYAVIQGKKYPQVEAWMTIGRMDNVVARESATPVRHDDGAYEAEVELVRLSDGMVVGRASALCGMPDDKPWNSRPEYARRSMAVTRATSRAFRQQYSWIMALAGYEPTPADEMPHDLRDVTPRDAAPIATEPTQTTHDGGLIGTVEKGKPPVDMETRHTPNGPAWGFKLTQGRKGYQALAIGPLAEALSMVGLTEGTRVTVWGRIESIGWQKDGKDMPPYSRIAIERVQTPDWTLPAPAGTTETPEPQEAESMAMLPLDDAERAAIAGSLA